jgi:hypothetical protein
MGPGPMVSTSRLRLWCWISSEEMDVDETARKIEGHRVSQEIPTPKQEHNIGCLKRSMDPHPRPEFPAISTSFLIDT